MDRYGLAREFELAKFEMQIMKCEDLYAGNVCVKLFAQTKAQQLRINAAGHEQAAAADLS